jgi:hypothetical protein
MEPEKAEQFGLEVERPRQIAGVFDADQGVLFRVPAPNPAADLRVELEILTEQPSR